MKAKSLFILLSVLFIIPMSASTAKRHKHKSKFRFCDSYNKSITRTPLAFELEVHDVDNDLQILFLSPLHDAEIIVTDKDNNTVINELQTFIYENKTLYIHIPNAYPYTVEITSPTLDVKAEIVLEEY